MHAGVLTAGVWEPACRQGGPHARGGALRGLLGLLCDGRVLWQLGNLDTGEMSGGRTCDDGQRGFCCPLLLRMPGRQAPGLDAWMWPEGVRSHAEAYGQALWRRGQVLWVAVCLRACGRCNWRRRFLAPSALAV